MVRVSTGCAPPAREEKFSSVKPSREKNQGAVGVRHALVRCVTLRSLPYPLHFTPNDFTVRPLDDLAKQMRVSRAFLELCVVAGCPLIQGELGPGQLLAWLFNHYEDVRSVAGLKPLAAVEDLPPQVTAKLRKANALVTLLEFARMRATDWRQKRQLRHALERVSLLCDHAV